MSWQQLSELYAAGAANDALRALFVLAVAFLVAKLAQLVLARLLPRLTRRTDTHFDDRIFALLKTPVAASIVLLGAQIAALDLEIRDPFDSYLTSLFLTLAILIWSNFAWRFAQLILQALAENHQRVQFVQPQTLPALQNAATLIVFAGSIYFLLVAWHVPVSGWLASAGIAGLALGLAAKDTLANLFAGISLLADAPFSVGDFIVLDSGERGEITRIGLRSSRLVTRDDLEIIIPNTILADSKIINEAGGPGRQRRVRVKVQVAYGSDIAQVRELLLLVAKEQDAVCEQPEPRVRFRAFEDSGLRFELLCWVEEPVLRGRVVDTLNTVIYDRFLTEGIEFPYPKRDIYLHQVSQDGAPAASE